MMTDEAVNEAETAPKIDTKSAQSVAKAFRPTTQDDLMALMNAPAMTPAERRRMRRRAENVPKGYAYHPGTGPAGETCKSCAHCVDYRRWKKCRKAKAIWTGSRRTDILVGSPACKYWEAPTPIAAPDGGNT